MIPLSKEERGISVPRKASIAGVDECAKNFAARRGITLAAAKEILKDVLDAMEDELVRTGGLQFVGRWTLSISERGERVGHNPFAKEPMTIPAKRVIKFRTGKNLDERLNKKDT